MHRPVRRAFRKSQFRRRNSWNLDALMRVSQPRRNSELETRQVKRQVRIVEWIVQQLDSPLSLHVGGFAHELRLLPSGPLMTARSRFVMSEIRVWSPNVLETGRAQSQAKVYVVETNREIHLIEPAGLFENLSPHEHAGSGHR